MMRYALVLTIPLFATALAGTAQAFEPGNCNDLSSEAVSGFNIFKADTEKADFGDELHLLGSPQGTAVICWFSSGRVGVEGKVFADSISGEPLVALAEIRFQRQNGQVTTVQNFGIGTNISWVASRLVKDLSPQGNFDRVRLRLFISFPKKPTLPSRQVFSKTFHR